MRRHADRLPFEHRLRLKPIAVRFLKNVEQVTMAEGNNAAWQCVCGTQLMGRCYFQFGDTCFTPCENCGRQYRVDGDANKRAVLVREEPASWEPPLLRLVVSR